jgi:hypothetical protein
MIADGEAKTPFMKFGDTIRIEMLDANGKSIFGAISQQVVQQESRPVRARRDAHRREDHASEPAIEESPPDEASSDGAIE